MLETTRTYWHQPAAPFAAEPQAAGLNAAVRSLFAKLSSGSPEAPATPDYGSIRRLPPVWETDTGRHPLRRAPDEPAEGNADRDRASARRAHAHAAFRTVEGGEQAALDAALGVVEAEVARLRQAVLVYGEVLKAIRVYGPDEETREAAATALSRAPERLRAAAPVPQADSASTGGANG